MYISKLKIHHITVTTQQYTDINVRSQRWRLSTTASCNKTTIDAYSYQCSDNTHRLHQIFTLSDNSLRMHAIRKSIATPTYNLLLSHCRDKKT